MKRNKYFALFISFFLITAVTAQELSTAIAQKAESMQIQLTQWRRHLHQHPEMGNMECKSAS